MNEMVYEKPMCTDDKKTCMFPINVSARFNLFFTANFIIAVISTVAVVMSWIGVSSKLCRGMGAFLHACQNLAFLIFLILGSAWRWVKTGKICSADYAPIDETNLQYIVPIGSYWQYYSSSGACMNLMLIIGWVTIVFMCCCSCFFNLNKVAQGNQAAPIAPVDTTK